MKKILTILCAMVILCSCEDKECQQSVQALQTEIANYRSMSKGLLQITAMLDSTNVDSELLKGATSDDTLTREVVLKRISDAMSYIENSNLRILEMEENIEEMNGDNVELKGLVSRLRNSLISKRDSLLAFSARINVLEDENIKLASAVFEREREIVNKNAIINRQKGDLVNTQNELLMREKEAIEAEGEAARNKVMIEATKYFERALSAVATADKMSGLLKGKQKQEKYTEAYELFQKSYALGKSEAKREMIKLKEKMK